jgi:type IX secretion system PorP/SprF family membrane protein
MRKPFILLGLLLLISPLLKAQDPAFTQYNGTAVYTNPALTGSSGATRIQGAQRIQWPSLPSAYYTTNLVADFSFAKLPVDFGTFYSYDNAGNGSLISSNLGISFARSHKIYKSLSVRWGISASIASRKLDPSLLTFGDQIDSRYGFIYSSNTTISYPNVHYALLNAGLVIHAKRFLIGYSAANVNQPNFGFMAESRLPIRQTLHSSLCLFQKEGKRKSALYANVLYMKQQGFHQILPSISYRYGKWKAGCGFRKGDAAIGMLGYTGKRLSIAYSYDYTISTLTNQTGGAHEFTLGLILGKLNEKRPSMRWTEDLF